MNNQLVVPELALQRASLQSLRDQIHSQIASAIRCRLLPDGARLPSSRCLAKLLKVSRNTVVEAYEKLLEDELITAKAGSCVKVSHAAVTTIPNFSNLRRTAKAAHYPVRTMQFEDPDGTLLYLNVTRGL